MTTNTFMDVSLLTDYLLYLDSLTKEQQVGEKDGAFLTVENIGIILYYAQMCSIYVNNEPMFDAVISIQNEIDIFAVTYRFNFLIKEHPNDIVVNAISEYFSDVKDDFEERTNQSRYLISFANKEILGTLYYYFYKENFANVKPKDILEKNRLFKYFQASAREQTINGEPYVRAYSQVPYAMLETYAEFLFSDTDIKEKCKE